MFCFQVEMPGVVFRPIYRSTLLSGLSYQRKQVRIIQRLERRDATIVISVQMPHGGYHETARHEVRWLRLNDGCDVMIHGKPERVEKMMNNDNSVMVYFLDGSIKMYDRLSVMEAA